MEQTTDDLPVSQSVSQSVRPLTMETVLATLPLVRLAGGAGPCRHPKTEPGQERR